MSKCRLFTVIVFCLWWMPCTIAAQQADSQVTLEPRQTIEVRVGRWDAINESFSTWDSLGGTFRVGPDGVVTLPMAGTLDVSGLAPEAFAESVASRIEASMGLRDQVRVSVTIAAHQPIYVIGDVRLPGEKSFEPGMTVLQAIALAGGIDDPGPDLVRGDRSMLNAAGAYRVLELALLGRLATTARLRAELEDRAIATPELLTKTSFGRELIMREQEIKDARDESLQSNLEQLSELEALLAQGITRLGQQIELRQRQQVSVQSELDNVSQLVEQGLSTSSRLSQLEREVADQQVRGLELETAQLNAEQRLNETRRDRLDLINSRRLNLVESIQTQVEAVNRLRVQMETEAALYSEASDTGSGLLSQFDATEPNFRITRGGESALDVVRADVLRGGDVLEVMLPEIRLDSSMQSPLSDRIAPDVGETGGGGGEPIVPVD